MLTRRRLLAGAFAGLVAPLTAHAQPPRRTPRVGWLTPTAVEGHSRAFREAMRALGYVEGQTLVIDSRSADDDLDRLPKLAASLVQSRVDVIVAVSPPAIRAARQATDSIPIVMAFWGAGGLVESGLVASLTRPGGNVTGLYMLASELDGKRLEALLQVVPKARKVGVLDVPGLFSFPDVRKVADAHGISLHLVPVGAGHEGYSRAFDSLSRAGVEGLLVPSFPRFFREGRYIIDLTAQRRIPAVYEWSSMVDDGGLLALGPVITELDGRVAAFVDRILKGANPAVLPIEQPTKFELVINMKTAKALGLTIPPATLARADRLIY